MQALRGAQVAAPLLTPQPGRHSGHDLVSVWGFSTARTVSPRTVEFATLPVEV
ncbi:MAG TPA: hypothetical protein VEP50_07405 [bacterium]|nr:hypothetical protein [bacterium]